MPVTTTTNNPRQPTDDPEDEELEDLDDLDDLLPTFTKPPTASTSTSNSKPQPTASSSQPTRPSTNNLDSASDAHADDNEPFDPDFEAELTKGMESLLRELGMNPPPGGPLPTGNRGQSSALPTGANPMAGGLGMGDLEGEGSAELQALLSKLMEGGMDDLDLGALGLGGEAQGEGTQTQGGKGEKLSFQESIERTMKGLKDGAEGAKKPQASSSSDPLSALLAQLTSDPSALAALEGMGGMDGLDGEGEEGVGNVLDGMMRQLMTREILMEPLEELADKYPAYLASQSTTPTIPATQLASYTQQSHIISQILTLFRSPQYSDEDEEKRKEVYGLMVRMQEMGSPPEEVMGEMPEGLGFGGEEGCTIM